MWLERNPHTFCYCGKFLHDNSHKTLVFSVVQQYDFTRSHKTIVARMPPWTIQASNYAFIVLFETGMWQTQQQLCCLSSSSSSSSSCPSCPVLLPSFRFFANALIHFVSNTSHIFLHIYLQRHQYIRSVTARVYYGCIPVNLFSLSLSLLFTFTQPTSNFSNVPKNVPRLSTDNNITLARHYHKNNPNVLPCLHKN